jgi:TP901 family phage tail tape measure protein
MNIELIKASADFSSVRGEVQRTDQVLEKQENILRRLQETAGRTAAPYNTLEAAMKRYGTSSSRVAQASKLIEQAQRGIVSTTRGAVSAVTLLNNEYTRGLATSLQFANAHQRVAAAKDQSTAATTRNVAAQQRLAASSTSAAAAQQRLAAETQKSTVASKGLLLSWESLVRLLTIQILHQTVSLLSQHLRRAVAEASELQLKLAEIRAISDALHMSIGDWGKGIRQISEKYGVHMMQVSEAVYQTVSNQIAQGKEALEFVETASKLAMAAVGTHTDAVQALSSVINAYKLNINEADDVAAKLFETIKLGRVRLSELASDLGQVTPIAAQLGISVDELLGSIGSLTRLGMSASEAVTQMRNVFLKMIMPTREMRKMWRDLGVESGRALIQLERLPGAYKRMQEHAAGNIEVSTQLIQRIRGLGAVMEFTDRRGLARLSRYIKAIENSTEAYRLRAEEVLQTHAKQWQRITNSMRNYFIEDVGPKMLEQLIKMDKIVGGFSNRLEDLVIIIQVGLAGALFYLIKKLKAFIVLHPKIAITLTALGIIIKKLNEQSREMGKNSDAAVASWKRYADVAQQELNKATRAIEQHLNDVQKEADLTFLAMISELEDALKDSNTEIEKYVKSFEKYFEDGVKTVGESIKELDTQIRALQQVQEQITRAITGIRLRTEEQMFRFKLEDAGIEQQVGLWVNRIKKIEEESRRALNMGDHAEVDRLTRELERAFLEYRRLQQSIRSENQKTHDKRIELQQKERDLQYQLGVTRDQADRRKIQTELEAVRREMGTLKTLIEPDMDVPKRFYEAMQRGEMALQDLKKKAHEEELTHIEEKATLERKQNELTALMKEARDLDLLGILGKEMPKDKEARDLHVQATRNVLGRYTDIVDGITSRLKELGVEDTSFAEFHKRQLDIFGAHEENLIRLNQEISDRDAFNERLADAADAVAETTKELEEHNKRLNRISLLAAMREQYIQDQLKTFEPIFFGEPIDPDDPDKYLSIEERLRKRYLPEDLTERIRVEEAKRRVLQTLLDSQEKELADLVKNTKDTGDSAEKLATSINILTRVFMDAAEALRESIRHMQRERADVRGPEVRGEGKLGGPSYGSDTRYLSPGEFIMSREATGKLFNQFVTANSRTAEASGSNVNIGDINVTMQSHGDVNYDGRRLANVIRRQIRQGALVTK